MRDRPRLSPSIAVIVASATAVVLFTGCDAGAQQDDGDDAGTASADPSRGLSTPAAYDEKTGLWLSDGWPVPDPTATFDPDAPWMSSSAASAIIADCMRDAGWEVTSKQPGEMMSIVSPEQKSAYDDAMKACYVENRIGIDPAPPVTRELAETEYAAQVRTSDCIANMGIAVPELPSYQTFEDALLVEDRIISVYALAEDAGIDLHTDPGIWAECPDPVDTWGHNGP